jgi:hypothetical protein
MHSQRRAQSKASAASGRGAGPTGDHRKHAVLAILLLATALLVFLALVSYDPRDEAAADTGIVDLFKLVTGDQVAQARADTAQNWLGLAGAMISNFLITSTVGYSVLLFPFVLMLFGWTLLRRGEFGRVVVLANYTILFAFLLSTCLGMARLLVGEGGLGVEWSGVVGDFLSLLLTRLLGKVGASIVLAVSLFLVLVLAVDLDLHMTLDRLKRMWLRLLDWVSRLREAAIERARARRAERAVSAEERSKAPVSIAKASHEEPGPHAGFEVVQRPRRDEVSPGRTAALQEGAPDEAPPPSKEIRLTVMNKLKEATARC